MTKVKLFGQGLVTFKAGAATLEHHTRRPPTSTCTIEFSDGSATAAPFEIR